MVLPLSAVLVYSLVGPSMSRAAVGTMMLTVPLAARCWQSRHQQILVATGSAVRRKRTAPQSLVSAVYLQGELTGGHMFSR
jgi:hypothetical protein